ETLRGWLGGVRGRTSRAGLDREADRPEPPARAGALAQHRSGAADSRLADRHPRPRDGDADGPFGEELRQLGDLRPVLPETVLAHALPACPGARVHTAPGRAREARGPRPRRPPGRP